MSENTSQDPEFEGPTHHEKRVHQNHFQVNKKLRKTKESNYKWVEVGPGKYKLVKKEQK